MKKYRYIWLPALLLIYGMTMAIFFGPDLIMAGRGWQVTAFVIFDVAICIALSIFIRKRQQF
ncbi:MAG: hypothetical protein K1V75_06545 [Muribaculaceae bacterium]